MRLENDLLALGVKLYRYLSPRDTIYATPGKINYVMDGFSEGILEKLLNKGWEEASIFSDKGEEVEKEYSLEKEDTWAVIAKLKTGIWRIEVGLY